MSMEKIVLLWAYQKKNVNFIANYVNRKKYAHKMRNRGKSFEPLCMYRKRLLNIVQLNLLYNFL